MPARVTIENTGSILAKLKALKKRTQPASGVVGYTAPYAVYVHENLEARHTNGQAKYLEQPLREEASTLRKIVHDEMNRSGGTLRKGIYRALLYLQRMSMSLCPVLTGYLRNSCYVRMDDATTEEEE